VSNFRIVGGTRSEVVGSILAGGRLARRATTCCPVSLWFNGCSVGMAICCCCPRHIITSRSPICGGGIDVQIPPPTLIVRLWIYTEHVPILGHNGVRTDPWCSYRWETGVASRRARTEWLGRTRLSVTSSKRCCKTDDAAVQRRCQAPNWSGQRMLGRSKLPPCGSFQRFLNWWL
jgi:hypothetical protein